ncbi:MAG: glycosyltransferase family 2 protein [Rhodospirillum sp.]|nr:glycosyltransferase family 2 protein [Rhodospirillum sp.]MCF8490517.1 glycosyltransferase family 2 protein [Rhodospirillum sp.]
MSDLPIAASIIIPVFNGATLIGPSVASATIAIDHCVKVLGAVPREGYEIILSDDGSTDDTLAEAHRAATVNPLVRVVGSIENRGAGPARNRGAAAARGGILFFLDADDAFLPPHVLACMGELLRHPDAGLVKTDIEVDAPLHEDWRRAIINSVVFNTAVWRHAHEAVGGFMEDPDLKVLRCEDVFYCDHLMRCFPARFVEARTVRHRVREGGAFEGQAAKFSVARSEAEDCLTEAQKAVLPGLRARHEARVAAWSDGSVA